MPFLLQKHVRYLSTQLRVTNLRNKNDDFVIGKLTENAIIITNSLLTKIDETEDENDYKQKSPSPYSLKIFLSSATPRSSIFKLKVVSRERLQSVYKVIVFQLFWSFLFFNTSTYSSKYGYPTYESRYIIITTTNLLR